MSTTVTKLLQKNIESGVNMNDQLSQAVIDLHNIARLLETTIGSGALSADVRRCADRLHIMNSPMKEQNHANK